MQPYFVAARCKILMDLDPHRFSAVVATHRRNKTSYAGALLFVVTGFGLLACGPMVSRNMTQPAAAPVTSLTFPADEAREVDPFSTFTWTPLIMNPDFYELTIGTAPLGTDIYYSGPIPSNHTSIQPWGLRADGLKYYATLYTVTGGTNRIYYSAGIGFQTTNVASVVDRSTFYSMIESLTKQTSEMADGPGGPPRAGTVLFSVASERHSDPKPMGADCVDYSLALISLMLQKHISVRMRTGTLDGTGYEGHTMTEYWDPILQRWNLADATFGLVYFDDGTQQGQSMVDVNELVLAGNYRNVKQKFVSIWGDYVYRHYYMDPLSIYLNPVVPLGSRMDTIVNDPHPYLTPHTQSEVQGSTGVYVFEFTNSTDSAVLVDPHGYGSIKLTPVPSFLRGSPLFFSRAYGLSPNWSIESAPSSMKVYTFPVIWTNTPTLLSPREDATDIDPSEDTFFQWTEMKGARAYSLKLGTSVGGNDQFDSNELSVTALHVQLNSNTKYYVRVEAKAIDGTWYYRDTGIQTAH